MRINCIMPWSWANGPGLRYTIWVQGCSIHCPGCSNKDTWDPGAGDAWDIDKIVADVQRHANLDGITITGGEPLDQYSAVYELCSRLINEISIFLTTGYTMQQVIHGRDNPDKPDRDNLKKGWMGEFNGILDCLDIICTGPFDASRICSGEWRGSSNQEIYYLTDRGKGQSLMPVVPKEIHINSKGMVLETGFTV